MTIGQARSKAFQASSGVEPEYEQDAIYSIAYVHFSPGKSKKKDNVQQTRRISQKISDGGQTAENNRSESVLARTKRDELFLTEKKGNFAYRVCSGLLGFPYLSQG
mmetsp:Transcript_3197/g.5637  ORF Transcript_3197/g.5637 Transcript_3197/m.5637 type:complete len:106 (-) Transcript_3197:550-867(-)